MLNELLVQITRLYVNIAIDVIGNIYIFIYSISSNATVIMLYNRETTYDKGHSTVNT